MHTTISTSLRKHISEGISMTQVKSYIMKVKPNISRVKMFVQRKKTRNYTKVFLFFYKDGFFKHFSLFFVTFFIFHEFSSMNFAKN
jgi:hypothetical protein